MSRSNSCAGNLSYAFDKVNFSGRWIARRAIDAQKMTEVTYEFRICIADMSKTLYYDLGDPVPAPEHQALRARMADVLARIHAYTDLLYAESNRLSHAGLLLKRCVATCRWKDRGSWLDVSVSVRHFCLKIICHHLSSRYNYRGSL
jgi:hypothetical protein